MNDNIKPYQSDDGISNGGSSGGSSGSSSNSTGGGDSLANGLSDAQSSQQSSEKTMPSTFDVINGLLDMSENNSSGGYIDSSGTIHYKESNPIQTEQTYYNGSIVNTDPNQVKGILDKTKKISTTTKSQALDYSDTLTASMKSNRSSISDVYNSIEADISTFRIGDVEFSIPPEYISVVDSSNTISNVALRQDSTIKTKTGHSTRTILITLFTNGVEQINGKKVQSPFSKPFYMDGILAMIAQFKCTPLLPVINQHLNVNFNIYTVALMSMSISTVEGFPNCLETSIMLQEFDATAYTEVPNIYFDDMIEWDLQRYYYQRYIRYKLNPLTKNMDGKIKLQVLDIEKLYELSKNSDSDVDLTNEKYYKSVLDSSQNEFSITKITAETSNIFSTHQLQAYKAPSMQYLGGNDITFLISIETTDASVPFLLSDIITKTQELTRNLTDYTGIGFVKVDNDLINIFGVSHFMVNTITSDTVPGMPGLYSISIECVSYNIANNEVLRGFRPFEGSRHGTKDDLITKNRTGLGRKIKQDNIIEKKLTMLNLYPDLFLPTYKYVDEAITAINSFKSKNSLPSLAYKKLPRASSINPGVGPQGIYNGYVDPDFYFMYDTSYQEIDESIFKEVYNSASVYNKDAEERKESENANKESNIVTSNKNESSDNSTSSEDIPEDNRVGKTINAKDLENALKNNRDLNEAFTGRLPFTKPKFPNPVIGRAYAVGETTNEFEEAWKKGNEKWTYVTGGGTGASGGTGNIQGINHEVEVVTNNAVADICLSVLGRSWYFWGAFGGEEITQEYYDKMAKQWGSKNQHAEQRAAIGKGWLAFDCSALASWGLRMCGAKDEKFRRFSSDFHNDWDQSVSKDELQPGDILRKSGHIGVYIGNGQSIEANSQKKGINICNVGNRYTHYGRYNNVPKTQDIINQLNGSSSSNENFTEEGLVEDNRRPTTSTSDSNSNSTYISTYAPVDSEGNKIPGTSGSTGSSTTSKPSSGSSNSDNNDAGEDETANYTSFVTPEMLDAQLGGSLSGKGKAYCTAGQKHNVNPALAAAIAMHETGNGTSSAVKNKCNTCGWMTASSGSSKLRVFDSVEHSIDECVSLLNRKYISQGKTTLADIGAMYCPIGAANDPGGLNQHWIPGVNKYYKQITGVEYDSSAATFNGSTEGGSSSSGVGGTGGLSLQYTEAPTPPLRYPSLYYGLKMCTTVKELDLSSFGRPRQLYSPVNFLEDVPNYEDDEIEKMKEEQEASKNDKDTKTSKIIEAHNKNIFEFDKPTLYNPDDTQWAIDYGNQKDYEDGEGDLVSEPSKGSSDVWSFEQGTSMDESRVPTNKYESYLESVLSTGTSGIDLETEYKGSVQEEWDENLPAYDKVFYTVYNNPKNESDYTVEKVKERQDSLKIYETTNSMCTDLINFSYTGRMIRAFPTYLFLIADDGGGWLDAKKLWTNYYSYTPVVSIKVHQSKDSPIHTAYIELSNLTGSLSKKTSQYDTFGSIETDKEYNRFVRWVYKHTGLLLSSPKVTNEAVSLKNEILDAINLRSGARIHVRMGYGPNALNMPICFNGVIADMEVGEYVSIVAQSDGAELINNVIVTKDDDDTNSIFKYGSEPSNIIASIMSERENKWLNVLNTEWAESSKYGIEHFGIHLGVNPISTHVKETDLLKNIYTAKYTPVRFINTEILADGEQNINVFLANKTPWDVFKLVENSIPEFVCYPMYHQFETRLFFGLPWFEASYRYDIDSGNSITEQFKSFSQFHICSSLNSIIKNSIKTSSRDLHTNAICIYSLGGNPKKSPTIYSDRYINPNLQKTKIIDSTVNQDYLGWDKGYEFVGIATGKNAAINIATSSLLDSWNATYKGELIIIGDSSIKPYDYIYVNDNQVQMSGLCTVREVVHSFSIDTGFVTSVTPGLIAHSTERRSGSDTVVKSLLGLGLSMGAVVNARYSSILYANSLTPFVALSKTVKYSYSLLTKYPQLKSILNAKNYIYNSIKTGDLVADAGKVYSTAKKTFDTIKGIDKIKDLTKVVSSIKQASTTITTMGTQNPIVGAITFVATTILFDLILGSIIDEFQYNHSVYLIPLIYKDQAFASNTNGHSGLIPGMNEQENKRDLELIDEDSVEDEGSEGLINLVFATAKKLALNALGDAGGTVGAIIDGAGTVTDIINGNESNNGENNS